MQAISNIIKEYLNSWIECNSCNYMIKKEFINNSSICNKCSIN